MSQSKTSQTKMMKAALVREFKKPLTFEEVPVPEVSHGQVLVRVEACGVCHTDLHAANGDWPILPRLPLIPGHEGVGTVVNVGPGVHFVKEGDRVGVPWLHSACGHCEYCLQAWETLCLSQQTTGYSVNGSYAEYVLADADYVGKLPPQLSFEEAAPILCAGVTVYKGLKELETRAGEWVVITGIGGLGHLGVQYAKAMGMNVVAIDVDKNKLDLAKRVGADLVINCSEENAVETVQKQIGGAHGALVTAASQGAFKDAVGMLRRKGTLSLTGLPPGSFPLSIFDIVLNRKTIRGSIVGTRQDLNEALHFAAEGKVKSTNSIESFDEINSIFERLENGQIEGRVVMKMQPGAAEKKIA